MAIIHLWGGCHLLAWVHMCMHGPGHRACSLLQLHAARGNLSRTKLLVGSAVKCYGQIPWSTWRQRDPPAVNQPGI